MGGPGSGKKPKPEDVKLIAEVRELETEITKLQRRAAGETDEGLAKKIRRAQRKLADKRKEAGK